MGRVALKLDLASNEQHILNSEAFEKLWQEYGDPNSIASKVVEPTISGSRPDKILFLDAKEVRRGIHRAVQEVKNGRTGETAISLMGGVEIQREPNGLDLWFTLFEGRLFLSTNPTTGLTYLTIIGKEGRNIPVTAMRPIHH